MDDGCVALRKGWRRRSSLAAATIIATLMAWAGPAVHAAAQPPQPPIISGPTDESFYVSLAANASGNYLIGWSPDFTGGPFGLLDGSIASGIVPGQRETIGDRNSDGEVGAAVAPDGTQSLLWAQRSGPRGRRVWAPTVATRATASAAWSVQQVEAPASGGVISPTIASGPQGQFVAAWVRAFSRKSMVVTAFRPEGGAWGRAQVIHREGRGARMSDLQIAFDASGRPTIAWARQGLPTALPLARTSPSSSQPSLEVRKGDAIEVMQGDTLGNFAQFQLLGKRCERHRLAVGASGAAGVVMKCDSGYGRKLARRIRLAERPAGGVFGRARVISGRGTHEVAPSVVVDSNGEFAAAWIDRQRERPPYGERLMTLQGTIGGPHRKAVSAIGRRRVVPIAFVIGDPDGTPFIVRQTEQIQLLIHSLAPSGHLGPGVPITPKDWTMIGVRVALDSSDRGIAAWLIPGLALEAVEAATFTVQP